MQLRMTAPLDIGLEQSDAALALGGEEMFDLGGAENGLKRKGKARLAGGEMDESSEEDISAESSEGEEEALSENEERERRVRGLEGTLDNLYDSYREKIAERDAKFKVKEARRSNKLREEEWGGVREKEGSDEEEHSDDESEAAEGGWDAVAHAKERVDDSSSSSEEEDVEEEENNFEEPRKRRKLENGIPSLVTDLQPKAPPPGSRAAQLWFSQDLFASMGEIDNITDEDEDDESVGEEEKSEAEASGPNTVRKISFCLCLHRRH
jgi:AdoMet-dependent rRNA methyltransferase SPB1